MKKNKNLIILFVASFLWRLFYVLYTPITLRQHDVGSVESANGHLGYISYLATHRLHLPDMDPRMAEQFYHPPLHHMISALWVKLNMKLGISDVQAYENIQLLTLCYSMIMIFLAYRMMQELEIDKKATFFAMLFLCFHPYLLLLSGSVNNDSLCIALIFGTILFTIRWYKNPKLSNIVAMALCLGLSMISKASGVFVAPGIAIIFMIKLFEMRACTWKLILQYFVFGVISIPIGISWSIYNYVKWGMPINYIPVVGTDSLQYLGNISIWKRLFGIRLPFGKDVFININSNMDYNVPITILKELVFDEFGIARDPIGIIGANLLFYMNIMISIVFICAILYAFGKKSQKLNGAMKTFFVTYAVVLVGMFFQFIFKYPYVCSMSVRYIAPVILIGAICLGVSLEQLEKSTMKKEQLLYCCIRGAIVTFCVVSCLVYIWVGYKN